MTQALLKIDLFLPLSAGPFDTDPHTLVGYRCLLVWHQPSQGKWHFCFKLQKPSLGKQTCNTRPSYLEDVRNGYNNLFYNPEEGCCVLQVTEDCGECSGWFSEPCNLLIL